MYIKGSKNYPYSIACQLNSLQHSWQGYEKYWRLPGRKGISNSQDVSRARDAGFHGLFLVLATREPWISLCIGSTNSILTNRTSNPPPGYKDSIFRILPFSQYLPHLSEVQTPWKNHSRKPTQQLQNYKQSCTFTINPLRFYLLLNALLNILYQVIASSGPLIVGICAHTDHEIGSFTLAHLRVKSPAKISDWVTPTEAR